MLQLANKTIEDNDGTAFPKIDSESWSIYIYIYKGGRKKNGLFTVRLTVRVDAPPPFPPHPPL